MQWWLEKAKYIDFDAYMQQINTIGPACLKFDKLNNKKFFLQGSIIRSSTKSNTIAICYMLLLEPHHAKNVLFRYE